MRKDKINGFPEMFTSMAIFIAIPISLLGELFFDYETNPILLFFAIFLFAVIFEEPLKKLFKKFFDWFFKSIDNNQP